MNFDSLCHDRDVQKSRRFHSSKNAGISVVLLLFRWNWKTDESSSRSDCFEGFKDNYSCAADRISEGVIASSRTRPSPSTRFRPSVTLKNDAVLVRRARKCREKEKEGKGKGKRKSERGNNGWTRRADREKGEYRGSRQITRETELLCVELLSP